MIIYENNCKSITLDKAKGILSKSRLLGCSILYSDDEYTIIDMGSSFDYVIYIRNKCEQNKNECYYAEVPKSETTSYDDRWTLIVDKNLNFNFIISDLTNILNTTMEKILESQEFNKVIKLNRLRTECSKNGKKYLFKKLTVIGGASLVYASNMFKNLIEFEEIDIAKMKTENIQSTEKMFCGVNTDKLDLSKNKFNSVHNLREMFYLANIRELKIFKLVTNYKTSLTKTFSQLITDELDLSSWDMSEITNLSYMFYYSTINRLNLDGWKTPKLKILDYTFANSKIKNLDKISFDTSNVKSFDSTFSGINIETLDLSEMDLSNAMFMLSCFGDSKFRNLVLPNFSNTTIINTVSMFNRCTIKKLDLSSLKNGEPINMARMFYRANIGYLDISGITYLNNSSTKKFTENMFDYSKIKEIRSNSPGIIKLYENRNK